MITLGRYHQLSDAQRDAEELASRGIESSISQVSDPSGLGGEPVIELQIRLEDLEKLEDVKEGDEQPAEELPYECPHCGSRNYEAALPSLLEMIGDLFRADELKFQCKDCQRKFKVPA